MMIMMNFRDDLDTMTTERLAQCGYRGDQRDTAFDRFVMFYMLIERNIPPIRYEVKLSTHLRANLKYSRYKSVLNEITQRLQSGEGVRPYLSKNAPAPGHKDGLLVSWGIHHLHLNSIKTIGADGFVAREHGQTELLFLRIEGSTAYLLDIVPHSEKHLFVNPRLLEIVDSNWPELHIEPKLVTGTPFSPDQIKSLRDRGVNYVISVNGRNIFPKPVTANGVPVEVQMRYRVLCDELSNVETDVRRRFYEYFPHRIFAESRGSFIPEARLVAIEDEYFVLQEQATKRLCHARRVSAQK